MRSAGFDLDAAGLDAQREPPVRAGILGDPDVPRADTRLRVHPVRPVRNPQRDRAVPAEKTIAGMNSSLIIDLPVMLGVMGILCIPTLLKGRLQRWQGILLLAVYAAFTIYQFVS